MKCYVYFICGMEGTRYPGAVSVSWSPPEEWCLLVRNGSCFRTKLEGLGHCISLTILY